MSGSADTQDKGSTTDANLSLFPWFSVAGIRRAIFPRAKRQYFLSPDVILSNPAHVLDLMEEERIGSISLSTSFAALLLELLETNTRRRDLSGLKRISLGAEPILPMVFSKLVGRLVAQCQAEPKVVPGYGMTETGVLCSVPENSKYLSSWLQSAPPVSVGQATEGWKIRVVDDTDQMLGEGEEGHLQVQSSEMGFTGYLGETPGCSTNQTSDGWFRTGDLGWIRDGWVWVCGRAKDTIIINGRKYAPELIERSLMDVPGVHNRQVYACRVREKGAITDALGIVFVPDPTHPIESVYQSLRKRLASDLRLGPNYIAAMPTKEIPRTATGKLQRNALATMLLDRSESRASNPIEHTQPRTYVEYALSAIWQEVLVLPMPPGIHEDFFALGGHSLLSAKLLERIDRLFDGAVPMHMFFQKPTIAGLAGLIEKTQDRPSANLVREPRRMSQASDHDMGKKHPEASNNDDVGGLAPPRELQTPLYRRLMSHIGSWAGDRAAPESLIVGQNVSGTQTPLFWVFQGENEMLQLASALGSDQPLYGLRSGHLVMEYTEDNTQAIALDYVREIEQLCQRGPLIIGGNCQGGIIALAIAQHLLRRRRHVPLLILMEWCFRTQPYPGPVGLLFGRESETANPYWFFQNPELMWRRCWPRHTVKIIPGAHGQFFNTENVKALAATVRNLIKTANEQAMCFLPAASLQAELSMVDPLEKIAAGEERVLQLKIHNRSEYDWPNGRTFGLTLANQWLDSDGNIAVRMDGATAIPCINTDASRALELTVHAPHLPGTYQLLIQVIEEGVKRRKNDPCSAQFEVRVTPAKQSTG